MTTKVPGGKDGDPVATFRKLAEARLNQEEVDVLTPPLYKELMALANTHGLYEVAAAEAIRAAAAACQVTVVTEQEAVARLKRRVDQLSKAGPPGPTQRATLYAEATQLGVSTKVVDALLSPKAGSGPPQTTKKKKQPADDLPVLEEVQEGGVGFAAVAIVAGVLGLGGLLLAVGFFVFPRSSKPEAPPVTEPLQPTAVAEGTPAPPPAAVNAAPAPGGMNPVPQVAPAPVGGAPWGDLSLARNIQDAVLRFPADKDHFERIRAADTGERARGYIRLAAELPAYLKTPEARDTLRQLVAACYVGEPTDANVQPLREFLLLQLPPDNPPLPAEPTGDAYERAFWSLQVVAEALTQPGLPAARGELLARGVEQVLGKPLDRSLKPDALFQACGTIVAERYYKPLVAAVPTAPDKALFWRNLLAPLSQKCLSPDAQEKWDVDFLLAALPAVQGVEGAPPVLFPGRRPGLIRAPAPLPVPGVGVGGWRAFEPLIATCVNARDPANLRRLVDFYERTTSFSLEQHLGQALITRTGAKPSQPTRTDIAAAVRTAISSAPPPVAANRPDRFRDLARDALAAATSPPDKQEKLFQETVNLTHAATLGSLLAVKGAAQARFDALAAKPPKLVEEPSPAAAGPGAALPAPGMAFPGFAPPVGLPMTPRGKSSKGMTSGLPSFPGGTYSKTYGSGDDRYLDQQIQNLAQNNPASRASAFGDLAQQLAARGPAELTHVQADAIARYLLAFKTREELDGMLKHLKALAGIRALQIATADWVIMPRAATATQATIESIVSELVGKETKVGDNPKWREECRKVLLKHALDQLESESLADKTAEELRNLYREQAAFFGRDPSELAALTQAAPVLERLIQLLADQLGKEKLAGPGKDYLARYPHEVTAALYLGRDDLQKTVLLQRVWLQLLAAYVARQQPKRAADAWAVCEDVRSDDRKATHILQQLRAGEEKVLRLWLMVNEK